MSKRKDAMFAIIFLWDGGELIVNHHYNHHNHIYKKKITGFASVAYAR